MPKVGKRHFPYTSKGKTAAKRYAMAPGKTVTQKKKGGYSWLGDLYATVSAVQRPHLVYPMSRS